MSTLPKHASSHGTMSSFPSTPTSHTLPRMENNAAPNTLLGFGGNNALPPGMVNTGGLVPASMPPRPPMMGPNMMLGMGSTGAMGLNNMQGLGATGPVGVKSMSGLQSKFGLNSTYKLICF